MERLKHKKTAVLRYEEDSNTTHDDCDRSDNHASIAVNKEVCLLDCPACAQEQTIRQVVQEIFKELNERCPHTQPLLINPRYKYECATCRAEVEQRLIKED